MDSKDDGVATVGIVGSGTMGSGIAMAFANAGIAARVFDASAEALDRARATVANAYGAQVARGKRTREDADTRMRHIAFSSELASLADVDLAIEAVFEDLAVKREVFADLARICRADAILATNTSTLDVDAIAAAGSHPQRSLGLHFFSPAHVMRLVEIVRGRDTSPETLARARELCARIGKRPVIVGNADGFVGNRMLLSYRREAEMLVLAGATPAQVDAALEAFGFAMGPFAVSDLAGIDIGWRAKRERIKRGAVPPFALTELTDALVAADRFGQKNGRGFYRYEKGDRARYPDAAVDTIVANERTRTAVAARDIADAEIVERCVYALVMEGGRLLDEGVASDASDIDAIWTDGYGFPRARGGPMAYARSVGVVHVAATIAAYRVDDPAFWRDSRFLHVP